MTKGGGSRGAWMRQAEAARLLGTARSTVAWRVATGRYRVREVHGVKLVAREDVERDVVADQAA